MKKANLIISIVMTIISVVIICICSTYPRAEAYGTGAPGPGLWPVCICVIVICMSVLLAIKTLKSSDKEDEKIVLIDISHIRVYLSMAVLLIYFFLLEPVGFIIPTFLMVTFFVYWFSKVPDEKYTAKKAKSNFGKKIYEVFNVADGLRQSRSVWLCLVISLVSTLAVYFVFKFGLKVPMNFGLLYI